MQEALSRQLANTFRAKIRSGEWAIGERLPTTRALAAEYQVSLNTVQSAFRELEANDMVVRHPRRGGFVKTKAPREGPPRATTIGIIGTLDSLDAKEFRGWNYRITRAAEESLAKQDFHVSLLRNTSPDDTDARRLFARLDHHGSDLAGLICLPMPGLRDVLDELDRRNIPWVTINRTSDHYHHNFVTADNLHGGELVGRCFAKLDLDRVLMLGRPLITGGSEGEKYLGFLRGYLEGGKSTRNVDYVICNDVNEASGYETMRQHVEQHGPPRGVFAVGDLLALGAIRYCREHGLSVPGDVGIVGSTGLDVAEYSHPTLTVLQQPMEAMGTEAVRMLLEMVREETRRLIGRYVPSPLIARESLPVDEAMVKELTPDAKR
ncbi:MAG: GntR family transcriptional regulator [Tepidisphaeraceae bacterium]